MTISQQDSIAKADKSNVFVILDQNYYVNKIDEIISDATKFQKINKDLTEKIKKQLNGIILFTNNEPGFDYLSTL